MISSFQLLASEMQCKFKSYGMPFFHLRVHLENMKAAAIMIKYCHIPEWDVALENLKSEMRSPSARIQEQHLSSQSIGTMLELLGTLNI